MYKTLDYDRILGYYLESSEWDLELEMFMLDHHLIDILGKQNPANHILIYSEIYRQFDMRRISVGGDFHFDFHLTPEQFDQIFDRQYNDHQRFAILFGMWWGLSAAQIAKLSDPGEAERCWKWLNFFLCNPEADPEIPFEAIEHLAYRGRWYKAVNGVSQGEITYEFIRSGAVVPQHEGPLRTAKPPITFRPKGTAE